MARKKSRKKHSLLKTIGGALALVCIIGVTVGITLALMNKVTDTAPNTFVGNAGLDLELKEPGWDNNTPDDHTDGGEKKASNYMPDMVIEKDPRLTNTSKDTTNAGAEYVAIKLEYQILDASVNLGSTSATDMNKADYEKNWETIPYSKFEKLATIQYKDTADSNKIKDGFNSDWIPKTTGTGFATNGKYENTVFYYKQVLTSNTTGNANVTSNLFDQVHILPSLKTDTIFECGNATHTIESTAKNHLDGTTNTLSAISKSGTNWDTLEKTLTNLKSNLSNDLSVSDTSGSAPYSYEKDSAIYYIHAGLIPFRIKVTGYAVQAYNGGDTAMEYKINGYNAASYDSEVVQELNKLMGSEVTSVVPAP